MINYNHIHALDCITETLEWWRCGGSNFEHRRAPFNTPYYTSTL
jgi:hypothetical protein